jgi:hypothetical protein
MTKKENSENENITDKKNTDWWRLEKFKIGRHRFS